MIFLFRNTGPSDRWHGSAPIWMAEANDMQTALDRVKALIMTGEGSTPVELRAWVVSQLDEHVYVWNGSAISLASMRRDVEAG